MRVLIVEESMWGNTAALARTVADALRDRAEVEVRSAADAPARPDPDLLVVAAPTHGLTLPSARSRETAVRQGARVEADLPGVREWLTALPRREDLPVAVFDTKVRPMRPFPGAARTAARLARRRGLRVVARESFLVDGSAGPLVDGEVERAARWAAGLLPARQRAA